MSRDNVIQVRVNDREDSYVEELSDRLDVSKSEALRIIIFDSRFFYSDQVSFGDINIPKEYLVDEEDSETSIEEAAQRIG